MKKLTFFFFACVFCLSANGQLLRGDIYNFEIGDRYCVEHYWNSSSFWNLTTGYDVFEITDKVYNANLSSVTYTANKETYTPALPGNPNASLTNTTVTFSHHDLLSNYAMGDFDAPFGLNHSVMLLEEPDPDSCLFNNSHYAEQTCGGFTLDRYVFGMYYGDFPPCFEPPNSEYYVQEGCGGPYGGWQLLGDPSASYGGIRLIWFQKGGQECGTLPNFAATPEHTLPVVQLYPNPASEELKIETPANGPGVTEIALLSLSGQVVRTFVPQEPVLVSGLESGVYFVAVTFEDGICTKQKIVVDRK